jgi:hypothetical protein
VRSRVRALCDLAVPEAREYVGLHHDYDGVVQDLSPVGVRSGLAALGGTPVGDPHDEAHLRAAEEGARTALGLVEEHRRNPLLHVANLDLSCYDRPYAPEAERDAARRAHLAAWPDAVDAAVEALDRVPAPVARATLGPARGLAAGLPPGDSPELEAARRSLRRLVAHLESLAAAPGPEVALGGGLLARLMGDPEATVVDLSALARRAEAERARVLDALAEATGRLAPGRPPAEVVGRLLADHPGPGQVDAIYRRAAEQIAEASEFCQERGLLPELGGECRVGPAPPSRRFAMAMISWNAPFEDDAPAWYYVNPPDPAWSQEEQHQWLSVFSDTTLPAITVHEVVPGHFSHSRMLRRLGSEVRRALYSSAFVEGWAHFAEELMVEEGFRAADPRFAVGVWLEALVRVCRLEVAIGVHTGSLSLEEAARAFESRAHLAGPAARAEAERAAYDPTYGRYTWGKLEILALRDEARARWGGRFGHRRFHQALLGLGAPPLGLIDDALGP